MVFFIKEGNFSTSFRSSSSAILAIPSVRWFIVDIIVLMGLDGLCIFGLPLVYPLSPISLPYIVPTPW